MRQQRCRLWTCTAETLTPRWSLFTRLHTCTAGALGIDLVDDVTGEYICRADLRFGSSDRAGDEAGYLVGIIPGVWGPSPLEAPKTYKRSHPIRTIVRYNNTRAHTGVMGLWLMATAEAIAIANPALTRSAATDQASSKPCFETAELTMTPAPATHSQDSTRPVSDPPAATTTLPRQNVAAVSAMDAVLPVSATSTSEETAYHSHVGMMVGVGLLAVFVVVGAAVLLRRRHAAEELRFFWPAHAVGAREYTLLPHGVSAGGRPAQTAGGTFRSHDLRDNPPF